MTINEIQVGRLNAVLHKLLDMKEGAPAPSLAPEIVPALVLESDRPEWAFLAGERLLAARISDAATVAETAQIGLQHMGTEGLLVVIEHLILNNPVAAVRQFLIRMSGPIVFETTGGTYSRDNVHGVATFTGAAKVGTFTDPGQQGVVVLDVYVPASSVLILPFQFVLRQAGTLWIVNNTVNEDTTGGFVYRERHLEPSELR